MKIALIGGAGAMGLIFGARLAQQGHDVTLLDVNTAAIDAINERGALITNKEGVVETVPNVRATSEATRIGPVDLAIVFTKCYWTESAVLNAQPCIGPDTTVLSLQNGWGNYDLISAIVPPEQVRVGVTYISGTTLAPGHARQVGNPVAFIGRVGQPADDALRVIGAALDAAGVQTTVSDEILNEVFGKLAINVTTLPTSALLGMQAHLLIENDGTIDLMDELLRELVAVVSTQGITMNFDERRAAIHNLLKNAVGARGSMLQDVEAKRKTEIDVINGAIVRMGQQAGIPTPVNQTMVRLMKALESTF
jgi:2-dehydropantoate 2-reductase